MRGTTWAVLLASVVAAVGLIALVVLMVLPMKTAKFDCGTIVAGSDSWTPRHSTEPPVGDFVADMPVQLAIADLTLSQKNREPSTSDICTARHHSRQTELYTVAGFTAVFGVAAGLTSLASQSSRRGRQPAR